MPLLIGQPSARSITYPWSKLGGLLYTGFPASPIVWPIEASALTLALLLPTPKASEVPAADAIRVKLATAYGAEAFDSF